MQNSFSYFFSSSGWSETESTQYMIHNRQDNVDVIKYTTKKCTSIIKCTRFAHFFITFCLPPGSYVYHHSLRSLTFASSQP